MAKCISFRLTSTITSNTMAETAPYRVTLEQFYALYITQGLEQEELFYCLDRVIMCQVDCGDTEIKQEFPEGCCLTILPPGVYEITLAEQYIYSIENGVAGIDLLFEPVDTPFIQSIIANGCS